MLDNIMDIVARGLQVSLTLAHPISLGLYAAILLLILLTYFTKGPRLGALVHIMGGVFFFFVIWNHPDYAWYKARPWNGGYAYILVMIMAYIYLPVKIVTMGADFFSGIFGPSGK